MIDDSIREIDFDRFPNRKDLEMSRFGSPKWKPEKDIEIDLVKFSNAILNARKSAKNESLFPNLNSILNGCDFTTSAIAYGFRNNILYSCGAVEGIKNQEIEILAEQDPAIMMCRLMLQSEKLKFKIGPRARNFIAQNYSTDIDNQIENYLNYKNIISEYSKVIWQLREYSHNNL